jgi:hypothetical protein
VALLKIKSCNQQHDLPDVKLLNFHDHLQCSKFAVESDQQALKSF